MVSPITTNRLNTVIGESPLYVFPGYIDIVKAPRINIVIRILEITFRISGKRHPVKCASIT